MPYRMVERISGARFTEPDEYIHPTHCTDDGEHCENCGHIIVTFPSCATTEQAKQVARLVASYIAREHVTVQHQWSKRFDDRLWAVDCSGQTCDETETLAKESLGNALYDLGLVCEQHLVQLDGDVCAQCARETK